jgi:predicted nuclease of predicted toxin-antitoxin system
VNFLADESVDGSIVAALRVEGHNVLYIAEMRPGIDDDEVLELANSTNSILLTEDKDFGLLVYRLRRVTRGVILVRLAGLATAAKVESVRLAIRNNSPQLPGAFCVISPGFVRIRNPQS